MFVNLYFIILLNVLGFIAHFDLHHIKFTHQSTTLFVFPFSSKFHQITTFFNTGLNICNLPLKEQGCHAITLFLHFVFLLKFFNNCYNNRCLKHVNFTLLAINTVLLCVSITFMTQELNDGFISFMYLLLCRFKYLHCKVPVIKV